MNRPEPDPFLTQFHGSFASMLRRPQLDTLWETLRQQADNGWYVYAIGEILPEQPLDAGKLLIFIDEINTLLHQEHAEDYCGIVYVDQPKAPRLHQNLRSQQPGRTVWLQCHPTLARLGNEPEPTLRSAAGLSATRVTPALVAATFYCLTVNDSIVSIN